MTILKFILGLFVILPFWLTIMAIQVYPDISELVIEKGNTLTLNCTNEEPVWWLYPKESQKFTKKHEKGTVHDIYYSNLTINPTSFQDTGYFICQSEKNASNFVQIYIYCSDENHPLAMSYWVVDAAMYDKAEIPCKPTSPNISVSLTRSGVEVKPIEKYDPKIGYIISTYSIIDSASFLCIGSGFLHKEQFKIKVNVHPPKNGSTNLHLEVTDFNFNFPIFENQNVTLNCSVITSIYAEIKYLEWEFPKNVEKKIIIGNNTQVKHDRLKFIGLYRIITIYNVTKDDQGMYSCKMVDSDPNVEASTHFLHIEDLNSIFLNVSVAEESHTVILKSKENAYVEFIATVKSFPEHTTRTWYNFQKMEEIFNSVRNYNHDIIDDAYQTKLRIKHLEMDNMGTYQLKINNSWITKTLNFTLIVEDEPSVHIWKNFSLGFLKSNYTLECFIGGYPTPQITWSTMNCNDYPNCGNNTFQNQSISQQEENFQTAYTMISIFYFEAKQNMILRCDANNSIGSSSASTLFLLTDYGKGVVMKKNFSKLITIGDDIQITCAVSKYLYTDNFTWFFQENKIIPSQGIKVHNMATNFSYISTLSISNLQKNNSGMYVCRTLFKNSSLSKEGLFESNRGFLDVEDVKSPSIVQSNLNNGVLHVAHGSFVKFAIQVDGTPFPTVVWYKNGENLSFNDRVIQNTSENGHINFYIDNISKEDEAVYSFVATNRGGSVSDKVELMILGDKRNNLGFAIFLLIPLIACLMWMLRKINKKKKELQRILEEYNLQTCDGSDVSDLDSQLEINEQADLLPYRKKFEFPKEKLNFGEKLGSGEFGVVYEAVADGIIEKNVKTIVAIKKAKEKKCIEALVSELKIIAYAGQHPNVVNLLGVCTKDLKNGDLAIIVEFCMHGNLRDFLTKQRKKDNFLNQISKNDKIDFSMNTIVRYENISLGNTEIASTNSLIEETSYEPNGPIKTVDLIRWSIQAARGMEYLADRKILHGDLAARNVLLTERYTAKISDFGYSKKMYQNDEYKSRKTLFAVKWMAIESIEDKIFSTKSDIWAFGITLWEIFSLGISPYPGLNEHLYQKLKSGYRMEKPMFATNQIYNLMKKCWNEDPELRPSFTELREQIVNLQEQSNLVDLVDTNETNTGNTNTDEC